MRDPSPPRLFAVTTSGLTATRWLSQVLISHPDVFVAHGKFALDTMAAGNFEREKTTASLLSLSRGNDLRGFYESHSLEEVLAAYRQIKPDAAACGCVHSYTVHSLALAARQSATLDQLRLLNVVRHPITFLASHYGLVRTAEKHPPLYRYYLNEIFPQVLQQFPELYLLPCPDFRSFLAFAVSCQAVANAIFDLCYPGIRHLQMEALTSKPELLRQVCEGLTGLPYAAETMEEFIRHGAINRHRNGPVSPPEIYATWEPWQRDMAHLMIPPLVLDWFENLGYDLTLLRAVPCAASSAASTPVRCLADYLRFLDLKHPLLKYLTPTGSCRAHLIDSDYQGFQWARQGSRRVAWASSLGTADVNILDADTREDLRSQGLYLEGETEGAIWRAISLILSDNPQVIGDCSDYNIIRFRGRCYAIRRGYRLDLERLVGVRRRQLMLAGKLIVLSSETDIETQIDDALWQVEMRRQQSVVANWPPVQRWLWNTRKKMGRLKRSLVGRRRPKDRARTT